VHPSGSLVQTSVCLLQYRETLTEFLVEPTTRMESNINLFTEPDALKDSFEAKVYTRLLAIADAEKSNADDTGDEVDWTVFEYAESNVSQWAGHNEKRIWKHV